MYYCYFFGLIEVMKQKKTSVVIIVLIVTSLVVTNSAMSLINSNEQEYRVQVMGVVEQQRFNIGGSSEKSSPTFADIDSDGVEVNLYGTNPLQADTDRDGFSDGIEITYNTDPLNPNDYPIIPTDTSGISRTVLPASVPAKF